MTALNHELIDAAITQWLKDAGLQTYMRDKVRPAIRMEAAAEGDVTHAIASWKFIASASPGWDEVRQDLQDPDEGGDPNVYNQVVTGHRALTVSCHVESIRNDAPNHAFALAETARTRLRLPEMMAVFRAAGIALARSSEVRDLSWKDGDGRVHGMAGFDFVVNAAVAESADPVGTIGTIELSTNWIGEDGNPLPAAYQLNEYPLVIDP